MRTACKSQVNMQHACAIIGPGGQWHNFRPNEFIDNYSCAGYSMKTIHAEDNALHSYYNNRREYRTKKSGKAEKLANNMLVFL